MGSFRMTVGNAEIVALSDMNCVYPTVLAELWPQVPVEAWEAYKNQYPDTFPSDKMRIEIGCYLVRSQGQTILIDTGYGPCPIDYIGRLKGELMADLASKKADPGEIDTVFISHLHLDHVGWNTIEQSGKWVPAFPKARYLAHQADLDYFRKPEVQAAAHYPYMDWFVEPQVDQRLFDTCSGDHDLTGEVRALHTPGHTPGHMSVMISSSGQGAVIQGDVLIHPAQVTEDDWNAFVEWNFDTATDTRRKLLDQVEADGTTVISCHFPASGFGKVVRVESRRHWQVGI